MRGPGKGSNDGDSDAGLELDLDQDETVALRQTPQERGDTAAVSSGLGVREDAWHSHGEPAPDVPADSAGAEDCMPVDEPMIEMTPPSSQLPELEGLPSKQGTLYEGPVAAGQGLPTDGYSPLDLQAAAIGTSSESAAEPFVAGSVEHPAAGSLGYFDAADLSLAPQGSTTHNAAAAVDARELDLGDLPQSASWSDQHWDPMQAGPHDVSDNLSSARGRMQTGILDTTPWEAAPGEGNPIEANPRDTLPADAPSGNDPSLRAPGDLTTGAREIQLDDVNESLDVVSNAEKPWLATPGTLFAPRRDFESLGGGEWGSLELETEPQPPAARSTTMFDGVAPSEPPSADASPRPVSSATEPVGPSRSGSDPSWTVGALPTVAPPDGLTCPDFAPAQRDGAAGQLVSQQLEPLARGHRVADAGTTDARAEPQSLVDRVAGALQLLDKAVKTLNLYEGQSKGDSCQRAVGRAYESLMSCIADYGAIKLDVTPYEFLCDGEAVLTSEDARRGMTYRMFRDGVRTIELLPALTLEEFKDLLNLLRDLRQHASEEDTVTRLWEREFEGLRYKAVDFFLEGTVAADSDELEQRIIQLVALGSQALHQTDLRCTAAQQVISQVSGPLLEQAQQQRVQCLASVKADAAGFALPDELSVGRDQWKRAVSILVQLMVPGQSEGLADSLARMILELVDEQRWPLVAEVSQALSGGIARHPQAAEGVDCMLHQLCRGNGLLGLHKFFAQREAEGQEGILQLLQMLPSAADGHLLTLAQQASSRAVQETLVELLRNRGFDLTRFYADQLRSPTRWQVVAAIEGLHDLGTPEALGLVRQVAAQEDPTVKLEALRVLSYHIGAADAPLLAAALGTDQRDVRALALGLLERLKPEPAWVPLLLERARHETFFDWAAEQRIRLLRLLAICGGKEANEFLIKSITALNPLRRKRTEHLRIETIQALDQTGGPRCIKLLRACLEFRPSKAVRGAIVGALARAEGSE